jgi:hypothetical protein
MRVLDRGQRMGNGLGSSLLVGLFCSFIFLLVGVHSASPAGDTLTQLKDETLTYFQPLKGKVVSVDGKVITSDLGTKSGIKKGMRVTIFRQGMPFVHPVTKEPMGVVETPGGKADVRDVRDDSSTMEIIQGDAKTGDLVRVSEMKVRVVFFQDRTVDWDLGDSYYQLLKESGRFDFFDTSLDTGNDARILDEAKKLTADAVLILTEKESRKETLLRQRILWVEDASTLTDSEIAVDSALVKELRSARSRLSPVVSSGDMLSYFDLPFRGRLIAFGDLNGDGTSELIISNGRDLQIYTLGASLLNIATIKGTGSNDHLWIGTMDVNADGREEIIVTSMRGRQVSLTADSSTAIIKDEGNLVSYIYGLKGPEYTLLWKGSLFLRALSRQELIAQNYRDGEGFTGPVFRVTFESGQIKMGEALNLPKGVNIYDFAYMTGPDAARYVLAYDDAGFLNLYNESGLKVWRSKDPYGGFIFTVKKTAPTVMVERGEWSVKDRLQVRNRETLLVKRIPLAEMAKGLGYKSSQIRTLWWNGISMEENVLIDGLSGGVMDYALASDRLLVLSSPLFGIKAKNILKGESPLGSILYVYSLKGR